MSEHPQKLTLVFFLMIRRPPRSTLDRSSAASDVYKRQVTLHPSAAKNLGVEAGATVKLSFEGVNADVVVKICLLYTSPSPRDRTRSRMPSSA